MSGLRPRMKLQDKSMKKIGSHSGNASLMEAFLIRRKGMESRRCLNKVIFGWSRHYV